MVDPFLPAVPADPAAFANVEMIAEAEDAEREHAAESLRRAEAGLAGQGVEVATEIRRGQVAHEILRAAEEWKAELVAVGPAGRSGLEAFLLGSVARNVARHARCSVLVARAPAHGLHHALLAVDESEHSTRATDVLASFPLPPECEIITVNVAHPYEGPAEDAEIVQYAAGEVRRIRHAAAAEVAARARARLVQAGKRDRAEVRVGDPASAILKLAEEQEADLIVAGARGVSLIEGLLVGSVADRLLNSARCSLLLAR
jgi:nucleotide-binding universal stress UspA family protein